MKRAFLFVLILCISLSSFAQIKLSPEAQIHVLTCGPYQPELYSAFGHSAVRITDPVYKLDLLFNYGVFDFDQPNFYLNFARGFLNYKLDVMDYSRFRDFYIYQNRSIHEQVLNLTATQKQEYFEFLYWNAQPENQYYYYDYFYDNCATRIRDGLKQAFGEDLHFDGSYITSTNTLRGLTDIYLKEQPWGDLGIDLCLGMPMDVEATPDMHMFLPDYIESGLNNAFIRTDDGEEVPLVRETIITYEATPEPSTASGITPLIAFTFLLVAGIIITYLEIRKGRNLKLFDVILFSLVGLVGWLLFLLWVATDHGAAARNYNLLWALPVYFPIAFWLLRHRRSAKLKLFFKVIFFLNVIIILCWSLIPQDLHNSLVPLVALLGLRAWSISR